MVLQQGFSRVDGGVLEGGGIAGFRDLRNSDFVSDIAIGKDKGMAGDANAVAMLEHVLRHGEFIYQGSVVAAEVAHHEMAIFLAYLTVPTRNREAAEADDRRGI